MPRQKISKLKKDCNYLQIYFDDIKDWCQGRFWWARAILLFYMFHVLVCHLRDPMSGDIFKGLNLGIHEIGHVVFAPGGEFLGVAGGTLLQCLLPLISILMFLFQRDYFAIVFCFAWLSTNLFDVAIYAADARTTALPLVTPFKGEGEVIHDWNYILDKLDWLQYDYLIANFLRVGAVIAMLIFLVCGSWLVFQMMKSKSKIGLY